MSASNATAKLANQSAVTDLSGGGPRSTPIEGKLASMLDESFHEFDRLMTKAIEQISEHTALARDYNALFARQQALRLAGSAFVCEAAMALADARRAAA